MCETPVSCAEFFFRRNVITKIFLLPKLVHQQCTYLQEENFFELLSKGCIFFSKTNKLVNNCCQLLYLLQRVRSRARFHDIVTQCSECEWLLLRHKVDNKARNKSLGVDLQAKRC